MRYQIKEKFWSWGNDFNIMDAEGRPVFRVDGKAFSWGDDLQLLNMDGAELARIKQKLMSFRPKYEIYLGNQFFAEITKEFSWFKEEFTLDVPGPNDYSITGKFWRHEYRFERGGYEVARVSKQFFSWNDTYGIDIAQGEDEVAILCAVIVIDQVLHDESNNN